MIEIQELTFKYTDSKKNALENITLNIEKGDFIYIHDTGAHGYSMGYNYNGKLKCAELLLKEDGSVQLIRRAERPSDYFATFDCLSVSAKLSHIIDREGK